MRAAHSPFRVWICGELTRGQEGGPRSTMWIVCLLIPHLPVQVECQRDPTLSHMPLIVGGQRWDEGAVLDCCSQAMSAGVEPGMRLSRAETLCPGACFLPADEEAYSGVHRALIDSARRLSPVVETDQLGCVYADISGLKWRFEQEVEAARRLIEQTVGSVAFKVQIGVGSGKFVAQQAAQAAEQEKATVVLPGEEQIFLSSLELSTLPMDPEMERRLRLLGVHTLGTLANLPRLAVLRQFGSSAAALYDMAHGEDTRPVHADAPPLRLTRSHDFIDPVTDREQLLAHTRRMAKSLAREIDHRGYKAEGLLLKVQETGGHENEMGKPVKPPSSSAERLSRLIARMLGRMTMGGPVVRLSLILYPLRPFHVGGVQLSLLRATTNVPASNVTFGHRLRETLRRLQDRFGELSVLVASLVTAPAPYPMHVTTDRDGLPRALVWQGRIQEVQSLYEHWRERRQWWSDPIERDYFRLGIENGQIKVIFRDARTDQWYLERRHI